jgi:hypothetical protein
VRHVALTAIHSRGFLRVGSCEIRRHLDYKLITTHLAVNAVTQHDSVPPAVDLLPPFVFLQLAFPALP